VRELRSWQAAERRVQALLGVNVFRQNAEAVAGFGWK
jgi:hypothetical protein